MMCVFILLSNPVEVFTFVCCYVFNYVRSLLGVSISCFRCSIFWEFFWIFALLLMRIEMPLHVDKKTVRDIQ